MARILVIDDDTSLLEVLSIALADAGHEALAARDGAAGRALMATLRPDLVVSDINMPKLDGFALVRLLREEKNPIPIILLTSRDNEIDEALGLELGADDYVAKPFSTRVLLARIASLLRREQLRALAARGSAEVVVAGPLELDPERMEVRWRGAHVAVTVTELRLLEALVKRPGVVFSRDRLLTLARGDDSVVADRLIDTYVRRLRRKIEAIDPAFDAIETVIGAGYRWRG